jgi:hypothetical protein
VFFSLSSKQVIGAAAIFFGILISFIPKLNGSMGGGNTFWIVLFGLGNFILAPANVLLVILTFFESLYVGILF